VAEEHLYIKLLHPANYNVCHKLSGFYISLSLKGSSRDWVNGSGAGFSTAKKKLFLDSGVFNDTFQPHRFHVAWWDYE
jgi:hypothetical protein